MPWTAKTGRRRGGAEEEERRIERVPEVRRERWSAATNQRQPAALPGDGDDAMWRPGLPLREVLRAGDGRKEWGEEKVRRQAPSVRRMTGS